MSDPNTDQPGPEETPVGNNEAQLAYENAVPGETEEEAVKAKPKAKKGKGKK